MERKPVVPVAPTTRIEREFSTEVIASTVQKRAMHNMHIMHVHCHDANAATIVTYQFILRPHIEGETIAYIKNNDGRATLLER
jgi:hypothetical protein